MIKGYILFLDGILLNTFYSVSEVSKKLDIENERIIKSMTNKQILEDCYFLPDGVDIFETISWRNSKVGGKKEVHRYTLDGKYDKTFKSLADAAKELGLKSKSGISAAIKDPTKTSGGFKWSLIKSDTISLFVKNQELKPMGVEVYDKENNLIKTFKSVTDCIKEYPYCRKVLRGERKSTHNCIFKYIS